MLLRAAARKLSVIALITTSRLIPFSRSKYSKMAIRSLFIRFLVFVPILRFFHVGFLFALLAALSADNDVIAVHLVLFNQVFLDRKSKFFMLWIDFDHFCSDSIAF